MNRFAKLLTGLAAVLLLLMGGARAQAAVSGAIQNQSYDISLDLRPATLKTFADALLKQTGIVFSFDSEIGATPLGTISMHHRGASLDAILTEALSGHGLSWKVVNNTVAVVKSPSQPANRDAVITGRVTDQDGRAVPGAVVMRRGDSRGATSTDLDGHYSLRLADPERDAVEVSCLGYKTATEDVRGRRVVNFTIEDDATLLEETVVVGYGVQKKVNLTGSVAQVNFNENLESRPVMNTSSALAGLVAGMQVQQSSGQPGSDAATIRIRGNTTLNTNSPLVLVDGIEWSMDNINTNDIASITVLKDAASTAIYGSRAANGVILVTTKLGSQKDHSKVTYSFNGIWQRPYNRLGWVSDYVTHMQLVNESRENMDQAPLFSDHTIEAWQYANAHPDELNEYGVPNHIAFPNTDWFSEIFATGFSQEHNVSVEGSANKTKYLISIGYLDNEGVMNRFDEINSGTKKVNFRANVEGNVSDWITIGARIFGNRQSYGLANVSNAFSYIYQTTPGVAPGVPGAWGQAINKTEEASTANNIFSQMRGSRGHSLVYRLNASMYAKFRLLQGLDLEVTGNYAPDFTDKNTYSFNNITWNYTSNTMVSESNLDNATNSNSYAHTDRVNTEALLRYNTTLARHSIGAIAGFSSNYYHSRSFNASKIGSPDWNITEMSSYTDVNGMPGSSSAEWSLLSWFGRVNYAFADKYLLEANLRADGSSRFAPETRWGFFPSFSAGWRLDQENFLKDLAWLESLKLRASWGITGNNNSGNYAWQATYNTVNVVVDKTDTKGLLQTALGNNLLEWETTYTTNVGLDFGLWGNRLTGEIDAYVKDTDGILFRPSIYETMGDVTGAYANIAQIRNTGAELSLQYRDRIGKEFNYGIGLNLGYNYGKVKKYKGALVKEWYETEGGKKAYRNNYSDVAQSGFGGIILEGHALGEHYLYQLYKGSGAGYTGGTVDINAGPKDGMIRTEGDMAWVRKMIEAGYTFCGGKTVAKDQLWYGDLIYADVDGDGNYGDTDDQDFTGRSSVPRLNAGLNLSASWKGFDVYALLSGAFGFWLTWNTQYYNTTKVTNGHSISRRLADDHYFYDPDNLLDPRTNISAAFPRLTYKDDLNNAKSSNFREYRGDYLKLKNIQLGYTIPEKVVRSAHINRLRVFVSAENIFTLTSYPGMDPEAGTTIGYPLMRSASVGAQLTF